MQAAHLVRESARECAIVRVIHAPLLNKLITQTLKNEVTFWKLSCDNLKSAITIINYFVKQANEIYFYTPLFLT